MINAWLIVNAFLNNNKFHDINLWLVKAAKKKNINLEIKTNAEIMITLGEEKRSFINHEIAPEFVLFWDKDIRLAKLLEQSGFKVFNSARAIELCDDKSLTHMVLQNAGIRMPRTIIAPMTFPGIGYTNYDFLKPIIEKLGFPMIIKEAFGSFGKQVYLVEDKQSLEEQVKQIGVNPMVFQEYIKSSFARDIRINVVGDRVVACMYRYSDTGDFRANISNGGKMKKFQSTKEQSELAILSCKTIGLDFAGVDLLFDENDQPIVCEVNSNAHFKNIFDCTGVDVADHIIDYIINKLGLNH